MRFIAATILSGTVMLAAAMMAIAESDRHGNSPAVVGHSNQESVAPDGWPQEHWHGVMINGVLVPVEGVLYHIIVDELGDVFETGTAGLDCGELALLICGTGQVCCVCTVPCSFSCQDADGDCAACPQCGSTGPDVGTD